MLRVLIRADATASMGTGHVMRCLAVAEALADMQAEPVFATVDMPAALRARLRENGMAVADLPGPAGGDADLAAVVALAQESADAVILDGYHFNVGYRQALRAAEGPVLAFDDTATLPALHADLIVNPALDAAALDYLAKAPGARLLLGPAYAPIRRDIRRAAALPRLEWAARDRILLTFGGSDPAGLTGPVMARLHALLPDVGIDVAVGGGNLRASALQAQAAKLTPGIVVHIDSRDMGGLMRRAGLAAAAAGGTLGELSALGTPTLLAVVADNQAPAAASAARAGLQTVETRGADAERSAVLIARAAAALWRDPHRRQAMAAAVDGAVDGQGAARIAAALHDAVLCAAQRR